MPGLKCRVFPDEAAHRVHQARSALRSSASRHEGRAFGQGERAERASTCRAKRAETLRTPVTAGLFGLAEMRTLPWWCPPPGGAYQEHLYLCF